MNRFEMPKTSNDLIRTLQTILWAIECATFPFDRRRKDLLHLTKGYRKSARVPPRWIRAVKDLTLQQLFDRVVELQGQEKN